MIKIQPKLLKEIRHGLPDTRSNVTKFENHLHTLIKQLIKKFPKELNFQKFGITFCDRTRCSDQGWYCIKN
jgi:hypothetical protein